MTTLSSKGQNCFGIVYELSLYVYCVRAVSVPLLCALPLVAGLEVAIVVPERKLKTKIQK